MLNADIQPMKLMIRALPTIILLLLVGCEKPKSGNLTEEQLRRVESGAAAGDPKAQTILGTVCYRKGQVETAMQWFEKAALQNYPDGIFRLGKVCFDEGKYDQAWNHWKNGASKGHVMSQYGLTVLYGQGVGQATETEVVQWLQPAAQSGILDAKVALGTRFQLGRGAPVDQRLAVRLFTEAAEQGSGPGQWRLGGAYLMGTGVKKDIREGVKWIRKAAQAGVPEAQYELGFCYLNGIGIKANDRSAFEWLERAGHQGIAESQYFTGLCY